MLCNTWDFVYFIDFRMYFEGFKDLHFTFLNPDEAHTHNRGKRKPTFCNTFFNLNISAKYMEQKTDKTSAETTVFLWC